MFGIGFAEILVILLVGLLVFGPDRLPEMTKQAASFVRDLRKMVANARSDIAVSAKDLGIDEDDLRTLRELRNPKAFVRDKVLDGLSLEELGLDDDAPASRNGGSSDRNEDPHDDRRDDRRDARPAPAEAANPAESAAAKAERDLPFDPDAT